MSDTESEKLLIDIPTHEDKDITFTKTQHERVGRSSQVYNRTNMARLVAGGLILNESHDKVLMISSTKHKDRWVLPKGGVELDESDNFIKSSLRETWEEAGVVGKILKKLPIVQDHRGEGSNIDGEFIPKAEYHFYEMEIVELAAEWPEMDQRQRKWCNYNEAKHELIKSKRPELIIALNDSDIFKNVIHLEYDEHSNKLLDTQINNDDY